MAAPLFTTESGLLYHAGKILVMTIGLPARGKTHISRSLERYLRWMGIKTLVVSLGDYRRKTIGGAQKLPPDYFNLGEKSPETIALRQKISEGCEEQIWNYFDKGGGQVVIYDANNGTKAARQKLAEKFDKRGIHVIMLESYCDNKEIIERNIRSVKLSSPDYRGWDPEQAVQDYYKRIQDHEKYYEPVEEKTWPFIRVINVGEKIMVNRIQGYVQSRIVFFLMNIHNGFRTIYFARSGQSLIEHSYKADSDLSPAGWEYAQKLRDFVTEKRTKNLKERGLDPQNRRLVIWTSTRRRAHHTAWPFLSPETTINASPSIFRRHSSSSLSSFTSTPHQEHRTVVTPLTSPAPFTVNGLQSPSLHAHSPAPPGSGGEIDASPAALLDPITNVKVVEKQQMSEINPGVWDGLTPDQARKYYPEEWERFMKDPYAFRAPRAESYHDLSVRLEPVLIELEREKEDLLIIGHASVIRCMMAYLIGLPASEIPAIEIARGDLLEVVPASYGVRVQAFHFWDGPGRKFGEGEEGEDEEIGRDTNNFYENYAEDTKGKKVKIGAEVDV